jgi:VWFA-related protein
MTRDARLALAFLLLGAAAGAQTPRFPAGADVVGVDASVVDGDGRPVRDLRASDFEVEVDGRARRVLSADFVDYGPPVADPPVVADAGVGPSATNTAAAAAPPPAQRRFVVIAVDRGELSGGGIHRAVGALPALLERLGPGDQVAVVSLPTGPRLDFTTDRAAVTATLARIGAAQEDRIAHALPLRERLDASMISARDRLEALESVLDQLARIPGPKSLVLVSGGITAVDYQTCATTGGRCELSGLANLPSPAVVERLRRIVTAAAASRTTFFSVFVSQRGQEGPAEKSYRATLDPLADPQFRATNLETLAAMSGGALIEVVAGAERAAARLADEMSGQYLLGLEPAEGDRDGRPHDITVKVRRDGVTVRARRQFVIGSAPPRPVLPSPAAPTVASADVPGDPPAPSAPGATRSDHVRRLEDARRLGSEGDRRLAAESFEDAAKSYSDAIALEPMYFMAHYGLGRARMGQKDYAAAITAFEQARRVFEERTERVRGQRAARDAEQAARFAAAQATRGTRGASGTAAGRGTPDLPNIDPRFSAAAEPLPELPPGLTLALGSAYFRSGRIADAEREYRAAIAAEPKLGEARINLAVVMLMTGKPAEAKEQLAEAKKSGAKVPAGLEKDVESALPAAR